MISGFDPVLLRKGHLTKGMPGANERARLANSFRRL